MDVRTHHRKQETDAGSVRDRSVTSTEYKVVEQHMPMVFISILIIQSVFIAYHNKFTIAHHLAEKVQRLFRPFTIYN